MKTRFARRAGVVGVGVLAALTLAGTALAEPNGDPLYRELAGGGSDTTQDVLNGLSDAVLVNGVKVIASYNSTPTGTTIKTKEVGCDGIARPANSGQGVDRLVASRTAGDGCLQFARSSSNSASTRNGQNLTFIPFATDAVAYAQRGSSSNSRNLTIAQLQAIYSCSSNTLTAFRPLLPQFGSGTRAFFLSKLGISDSATLVTQTGRTCISEVDSSGALIQENDGRVLTDGRQLIPFSVAQYQSQLNGAAADIRGASILGNIQVNNGSANVTTPSTLLNTGAAFNRQVYNVVPTPEISSGGTTQSTFVGPNSLVCQQTGVITRFGFAASPSCGSTTIQTAP